MNRLTVRKLQQAPWNLAFQATTPGGEFKTYTTPDYPGIALLNHNGRREWRVKGVGDTESMRQAVEWWNNAQDRLEGRRKAAGSVEALRAARLKVSRR